MDILFNSLVYLPFGILLVALIGYLPALAFLPRLIERPLYFSVSPILSVLIVTMTSWLLIGLNCYTVFSVRMILLLLAIVAIIRLFCTRLQLAWDAEDKKLLQINIFLIIPFVAINGLSAFTYNDAMTSWNYWANEFVLHQIPEHTFYPQSYALLLATCHQLLGSFAVQGPIKAFTTIFPFTILNCVAFSQLQKNRLWFYLCGSIAFLIVFYHIFFQGYADPMMGACMIAAIALMVDYMTHRLQMSVWLSGAAAIMAFLTKQPALVWALCTLPVIVVRDTLTVKRCDKSLLTVTLITITVALFWVFKASGGFWHNQGPMLASLHGHSNSFAGWMHNLFVGVNKYLIKNPFVLILLMAGFYWSNENELYRCVFYAFVLPGMFLWFLCANYEIREGMHLVETLLLFTFLSRRINQLLNNSVMQFVVRPIGLRVMKKTMLTLMLLSVTSWTFASIQIQHKNRIFPMDGYKTNIFWYFNTKQEWIYHHVLLNKNVKIGVCDNYSRALVYPYHQVIFLPSGDETQMLHLIHRLHLNYILVDAPVSPMRAKNLQQLAAKRPMEFKLINVSPNVHPRGFFLYQMKDAAGENL